MLLLLLLILWLCLEEDERFLLIERTVRPSLRVFQYAWQVLVHCVQVSRSDALLRVPLNSHPVIHSVPLAIQ